MRAPDENAGRRLSARELAAVNRRIARLCDELDALQCKQGMLERDIEHRTQGQAKRGGRGGRRNAKRRGERGVNKEDKRS